MSQPRRPLPPGYSPMPVKTLLLRARRAAWDDAVHEAYALGHIHDHVLRELLARNPYREDQ